MRRLRSESTYMNIPLPFLWDSGRQIASRNPLFWRDPTHMRTLMLHILIWEARDDDGCDRYLLTNHIDRVITFFVWQREHVQVKRVLTEILQIQDAEIDASAIAFVERYFNTRDWSCVDRAENVWARPHYMPSDDVPYLDPDGPTQVDEDEILYPLSTCEDLRLDDDEVFHLRRSGD